MKFFQITHTGYIGILTIKTVVDNFYFSFQPGTFSEDYPPARRNRKVFFTFPADISLLFFCHVDIFSENGIRLLEKFFQFLCFAQWVQKSRFLHGRIAFGWSMDNPSNSHLNSCLVNGRTSDGVFGHWNFPLSSLFCKRTNPSLSKYKALSMLCFRPQNR